MPIIFMIQKIRREVSHSQTAQDRDRISDPHPCFSEDLLKAPDMEKSKQGHRLGRKWAGLAHPVQLSRRFHRLS